MTRWILFLGLCVSFLAFGDERKTVIVTCASGELGEAAARRLAKEWDLILTGRNLSKLEKLQKELQAEHSGHYEISFLDYTDSRSIALFKEYLDRRSTPLSGVVLYHLSKLTFRTADGFCLRAFAFTQGNFPRSWPFAPGFGPRQNTLHISKTYF